jgi:tetratricopeptide (TPR) repeat protein
MKKKFFLLAFVIIAIHSVAQDAESYYKDGLQKGQEGKWEEAVALFGKTIELEPVNYFAWYNRGIARSRMNRCEEALADFEQTIKLAPDYKKAYLNRGIMRRRLTNYDGAIADYTALIEADPSYTDALYNRGIVYEMLGKKDSACIDYHKALEAGAQNMESKIAMCKDKSPLKNYPILRLTQTATSEKYGFTKEEPVKTGLGPFGGPSNQKAYIELLRDTKGNPVQYQRIGSCCQYKSDNAPLGYALLDQYKISYTDAAGNPATAVIYISMYDHEEPMILSGFKTIGK